MNLNPEFLINYYRSIPNTNFHINSIGERKIVCSDFWNRERKLLTNEILTFDILKLPDRISSVWFLGRNAILFSFIVLRGRERERARELVHATKMWLINQKVENIEIHEESQQKPHASKTWTQFQKKWQQSNFIAEEVL